jgi:hypothetical protein
MVLNQTVDVSSWCGTSAQEQLYLLNFTFLCLLWATMATAGIDGPLYFLHNQSIQSMHSQFSWSNQRQHIVDILKPSIYVYIDPNQIEVRECTCMRILSAAHS